MMVGLGKTPQGAQMVGELCAAELFGISFRQGANFTPMARYIGDFFARCSRLYAAEPAAREYLTRLMTPPYWGGWAQTPCPTLLIAGADDAPFLAGVRHFAMLVPHAELVILPGVAHAPHHEAPIQCRELVCQWLSARLGLALQPDPEAGDGAREDARYGTPVTLTDAQVAACEGACIGVESGPIPVLLAVPPARRLRAAKRVLATTIRMLGTTGKSLSTTAAASEEAADHPGPDSETAPA